MSDNVIDTRDLARRLEELKDLRTAVEDARTTLTEASEALKKHKATECPTDDDERDAYDDLTDELEEAVEEAQSAFDSAEADFLDEEKEELAELEEMESEISEWRHGETLVLDSYFREYAEELATDIGAISGKEGWPLTCIDWDKACTELQYDYSTIEYQGETYWYRSC